MSKKEVRLCPKCGSRDLEVEKTWNLTSPLPDKYGRITLTIMGVLRCKRCGYRWKATISKLKIGAKVEIEGAEKVIEEEKRPPKEIILDMDEIRKEEVS
jgi:predicted nucleic-acid-binding Zn-ribbon protein